MIDTDRLQKSWPVLTAAGLAAIVLAASVFIVMTMPPRTVVMATGAEGGANYQLGLRYADILARSGVRLRLVPTSGGLENLALLKDAKSGVDVGFIQGGTTTERDSPNVESLGTVFYEPLWFFFRGEPGEDIRGLRGRRISIGPGGSGTRALALELIKKFKLDSVIGEISGFPPQVAADKLIAGDIDAAFIITAWDSPVVQQLLDAKGIALASILRADAYIAHYPFLNKLVLPAGVSDLLNNRPPADVVLMAPKASIAVRADLNPAIQHLLLTAAQQIHSPPGIFQKAGQFPAAESIDLPLSDEAQRFYKRGLPFLQNYLPFWIATLIERILFVFLPLVAVLYPIFKFLPKIYDWAMQSKIRRLYDEMRAIESEMESQPGNNVAAIDEKLEDLGQRANRLALPTAYASMLYTLQSHINLVRGRLRQTLKKARVD